MKQIYSMTWTERHSAKVMAESQEEAEKLTYGCFDHEDTFESFESQEVSVVICPDTLTPNRKDK